MADGRDAVSVASADDRTFLRERRMRHASTPLRAPRWVWIVIVLLHLFFVLALRDLMRQPQLAVRIAADEDSVLIVRFIDPEPATDVAATVTTVPPATIATAGAAKTTADATNEIRPAQRQRLEARENDAMRASFVPSDARASVPPQAPRLRMFNADGSMRLSREVVAASEPKAPLYRNRAHETPRFMRHGSPIDYKPTRFESAWVPRDETLVGEFFRKATVEKTVKTPWGTKVKCVWILVIGGCSFGMAPTPLANAPRAPEPTNPVPPPPEPPEHPPPIAPYNPPLRGGEGG